MPHPTHVAGAAGNATARELEGPQPKRAKLGAAVPAGLVVQKAQRVCEACQRAVPAKAWDMHCAGKKHKAKAARMDRI